MDFFNLSPSSGSIVPFGTITVGILPLSSSIFWTVGLNRTNIFVSIDGIEEIAYASGSGFSSLYDATSTTVTSGTAPFYNAITFNLNRETDIPDGSAVVIRAQGNEFNLNTEGGALFDRSYGFTIGGSTPQPTQSICTYRLPRKIIYPFRRVSKKIDSQGFDQQRFVNQYALIKRLSGSCT